MNCFTLDNGIVCIFLLSIIIIGIWSGKTTKTLASYSIASIYGSIPLVIIYLATDIGGGSLFSDAASVYSRGIIVNISIASLAISYLLRAFFWFLK